MSNNFHDAYLESRVLTADPIELVHMLYQACMEAVREARRHLAEGRIAERSKQINRACEIVIELAVSLDHERGGELSKRLALLYDYIQRRLIEANLKQSDAPLVDVLGLLGTLAEGWEGIRNTGLAPKAAVEQPAPQAVEESHWPEPAATTPWSQPVEDDPRGAANPWAQIAVDSPLPQPAAANPWAQPVEVSPWAQPVAEEASYATHGWSLQG